VRRPLIGRWSECQARWAFARFYGRQTLTCRR